MDAEHEISRRRFIKKSGEGVILFGIGAASVGTAVATGGGGGTNKTTSATYTKKIWVKEIDGSGSPTSYTTDKSQALQYSSSASPPPAQGPAATPPGTITEAPPEKVACGGEWGDAPGGESSNEEVTGSFVSADGDGGTVNRFSEPVPDSTNQRYGYLLTVFYTYTYE